jgi:deoxycytidine triphosphate deaminase/guanylate kinase
MNTIIVLVGVGGAGKSTLLAHANKLQGVKVLQPSTTRQKRVGENDEYHFMQKDAWKNAEHAWTIDARNNYYGLRHSEIKNLHPGEIGLTVFHPGSLDTLENVRKVSDYEFVTVGIDTVDTHAELKQRTNNQPERDEGELAFKSQLEIVRKCDCVIRGDIKTVTDALVSTILALKSKGVLDKKSITNFLKAGTLLGDANPNNVQPASYDLCVGNIVWCRGKKSDLQPNDVVRIPPYSYIIVQAHEKARLPNFIIAHYDLKVSLFAQGVILSNGPQVDPGYDGVLLCMLFNGSDIEVGLKCGDHFATIEFLVTSKVTEGYNDHHQHQKTLGDFIDSHAHVSPGGTILQQFDSLKNSWDNFKTAFFLPTIGIVLATIVALVFLGIWGYDTTEKASKTADQAQTATGQLTRMVDEESNLLSQVTAALQSMHDLQLSMTNKNMPPVMTNVTNINSH